MSDKLKEKLLRQKERNAKIIRLKKKPAKPQLQIDPGYIKDKRPLYKKTHKQQKQRDAEETLARKVLTLILEREYDVENPIIGKVIDENPDAQWDELDDDDKNELILISFKNTKNGPQNRSGFVEKLLRLSPELLDDFIKTYLAQQEYYIEYYDKWQSIPGIYKQLQELYREQDANAQKADSDELQLQDRINFIKNDLLERARAYAESKHVDIGDEISYSKILERLAHGKDTKKIHLRIAKSYIQLAEDLGIVNPQDMNLIALATAIARKEEYYIYKIDPAVVRKIRRMSREKLLKTARREKIDNPDKLSDFALMIKIFEKQVPTTLTDMNKEQLIQYAKKIGVENPEEYDDSGLRIAIRNKTHEKNYKTIAIKPTDISMLDIMGIEGQKQLISLMEELGYKKTVIEGELITLGTTPWNETKRREQLRSFEIDEQEIERIILHERERVKTVPKFVNLVDKLSRITGRDKHEYDRWDYKTLQQRYEAIEDGVEFWEEFEREKIIDRLVELTGQSRDQFQHNTSELIVELERLEEDLGHDIEATKQCMQEFLDYKWINARVHDVYVKPVRPLPRAFDYVDKDKPLYVNKNFYKANSRFFALQCNRYSKKREQNGKLLTCYDFDNEALTFQVIFIVSNPNTTALDCMKINFGKYKNYYIAIQNEELFSLEKEYLETERVMKQQRAMDILDDNIDKDSINFATIQLGNTLRRVAPRIEQTTYVSLAINSILKSVKTNRELFSAVANVIVYLELLDANIFRQRVIEQYYLPEVLMTLSPEDKLPEIFDNPLREQSVDIMATYISNKIQSEIIRLGKQFLTYKNPTRRRPTTTLQELDTVAILEENRSICVNYDDAKHIPSENLGMYRDVVENKVYCLDMDDIARRFDAGDYNNPYTGKKFDKYFIRMYTIAYFDPENKKLYTFPLEKLRERFKRGKMVNKETGREFDPKFVQSVLTGENWHNSSNYRMKKFARLDARVARCVNPEAVVDAEPAHVVYYKDQQTNLIYCFTISQLHKLYSKSSTPINPYSGKKFSKEFGEKFKRIFNVQAHENRKLIDESKESEEIVEVVEQPHQPVVGIDVWELISKSVQQFGDVEIEEDIETTTDDEETTTDDETETIETETETIDEDLEQPESIEISSSDLTSSSAQFGMKTKTANCLKCDKQVGDVQYKSIIYNPDGSTTHSFCDLNCFEEYEWPRYHKKNRQHAKRVKV